MYLEKGFQLLEDKIIEVCAGKTMDELLLALVDWYDPSEIKAKVEILLSQNRILLNATKHFLVIAESLYQKENRVKNSSYAYAMSFYKIQFEDRITKGETILEILDLLHRADFSVTFTLDAFPSTCLFVGEDRPTNSYVRITDNGCVGYLDVAYVDESDRTTKNTVALEIVKDHVIDLVRKEYKQWLKSKIK